MGKGTWEGEGKGIGREEGGKGMGWQCELAYTLT